MHQKQEGEDWISSTYQHQQLPYHPALGLSVQNQQVHTLEMVQLNGGNKSEINKRVSTVLIFPHRFLTVKSLVTST